MVLVVVVVIVVVLATAMLVMVVRLRSLTSVVMVVMEGGCGVEEMGRAATVIRAGLVAIMELRVAREDWEDREG